MAESDNPHPKTKPDQPAAIAIIAGQLVVGGAERQLYLWLSRLDRRQFQPVVLTLHPGYGDHWEGPIEELGIPLHRIPHRRLRLLRLVDVIRVLRPYRPRLVHGWHLFASAYAGLAAMLLGAKSLGSVRGTYRTFTENSQEARITQLFTDAILANSKSAAAMLFTNRRRKKQKIFAVQNAVEEDFIERATIRQRIYEQYGLSQDAIWIGSIGRLDPRKRFDLLLQALALLKQEGLDYRFLLVGDGPERVKLEGMSRELGLENLVTFTGEVPEASRWLSALDIFCFTSQDEGMPNVIMEAAAAGLPIVSWRYPFIEELLQDRHTALLAEPGDLFAMKDALLELAREPAKRDQIGQAARRHVLDSFSVERYVSEMDNVYKEMLTSQPSPVRVQP